MTKKKSKLKMTNSVKEEEPKIAEEEESPCTKKLGSEIDEIFANKKRKKVDESAKKPSGENTGTGKAKKKKKDKATERFDGAGDSDSKPRKKTKDGLTIYTEVELGINKSEAGGTPLCPFDCSCCF